MNWARIPSDEISYLPLDRTEDPLPTMLAANAVAGRRAARAAILAENMLDLFGCRSGSTSDCERG